MPYWIRSLSWKSLVETHIILMSAWIQNNVVIAFLWPPIASSLTGARKYWAAGPRRYNLLSVPVRKLHRKFLVSVFRIESELAALNSRAIGVGLSVGWAGLRGFACFGSVNIGCFFVQSMCDVFISPLELLTSTQFQVDDCSFKLACRRNKNEKMLSESTPFGQRRSLCRAIRNELWVLC